MKCVSYCEVQREGAMQSLAAIFCRFLCGVLWAGVNPQHQHRVMPLLQIAELALCVCMEHDQGSMYCRPAFSCVIVSGYVCATLWTYRQPYSMVELCTNFGSSKASLPLICLPLRGSLVVSCCSFHVQELRRLLQAALGPPESSTRVHAWCCFRVSRARGHTRPHMQLVAAAVQAADTLILICIPQ
jgi:hypothetical protein